MFAYWGIRFFHAFTAQNRRYADWFFTALIFGAASTILAIPDYKIFLFMRRLLVVIVGLSSISYILFVSVILFKQKNPYIKSLTIGLLPLIICITYDVLFHNIFTLTTINDTYFSFLGIPGFLIVIAFTLSSKYVHLQNEVEHLNENLEHKVSERTQELTIANNKVEETNRQLLIMSQTDSLTGLYNRRYFMDLFTVEFERALRYENDLSFIILDIDHFKSINDTHGHQAGDEVLKKTAEMVKSNLRTSDCICRYGGEEFCMLLPQTNLDRAIIIAEKLRRTVSEAFFPVNGSTITLTASFGVTHFRKEDKLFTDLIERADKALYEAKNNGRNRVEYTT